ncbi:MAG TPA: hypothetical protein VEQ85_15760 [Lacipirellulaceae bacterium]|nr:hypothetical protein [Lacipirellulaceae bacterium]
MKPMRAPQQATFVVKWPLAMAAAAARELARRLQAHQTPATWSVDQASQVGERAAWSGRRDVDAALLLAAGTAADEQSAAAELGRRLELLRSAGTPVHLVHGNAAMTAGHWPRTLRAMGVHGVVVDGEARGSARALPFGVWQFAAHSSVPRRRRWFDLVRRGRALIAATAAGPAVVTIDLARLGAVAGREWRQVDAALAEAADARNSGTVALATLGQVTAQFTHAGAPRPQRSILRAA